MCRTPDDVKFFGRAKPETEDAQLARWKTNRKLCQDDVVAALEYRPETGEFFWRHRPDSHFSSAAHARRSNSFQAGRLAGGHDGSKGYTRIQIFGRLYGAHQLAWLYMTGEWPDQIDHINGDRSDNRFSNLRLATASQNNANRRGYAKSGLKGAHFNNTRGCWESAIRVNGKRHYLGRFSTAEEAHAAYAAAAGNAFGDFARF